MKEIDAEFNNHITGVLRTLAPSLPPVLYHFTSERGMRGIVLSGRMRASNIEKMNDHAEVRYATSIMRAHLDRAYAYEPNELAASLFNAMRRAPLGIALQELFVLSFTAASSDEGMWRLYGDRGVGYSFCLHTSDTQAWGGFPLKCQYDPKTLTDLCLSSLSKVRELALANPGTILESCDQVAAMFVRRMSWLAAMFKPTAWEDEREWRLLFYQPDSARHRTENGQTFIELPTSGTLPIKAICAGPNCDNQGSIQPLYEILRQNGYQFEVSQHNGWGKSPSIGAA